jgi:hypothetical protein
VAPALNCSRIFLWVGGLLVLLVCKANHGEPTSCQPIGTCDNSSASPYDASLYTAESSVCVCRTCAVLGAGVQLRLHVPWAGGLLVLSIGVPTMVNQQAASPSEHVTTAAPHLVGTSLYSCGCNI